MGLEPRGAAVDLGDKGYAKCGNALHSLLDDALDRLELAVERVDDNLVVHLHNHLRGDALGPEAALYLDHRELHNIGGRALNGGIDGVTLGDATHRAVRRCDVTKLAAATKHSLDIATLRGTRNSTIHICLDAWIRGEVVIDKLLSVAVGDVEPLGKAKGRDAIYDAEVGGLGAATLVACHLAGLLAIEACGSGRVDILAIEEGADECLVATEVGHKA